jgi:hypothetical protein
MLRFVMRTTYEGEMAAKSNHTIVSRNEPEPLASQGAQAAVRRTHPSPTRQWITDQVRRMYNDVVNEPLPDTFKDLLIKLDSPGEEPSPKLGGEKNARDAGN